MWDPLLPTVQEEDMWEDGEPGLELLVEEEGLQAVEEVAADAEEVGVVVVEDDHKSIFFISCIQQIKL